MLCQKDREKKNKKGAFARATMTYKKVRADNESKMPNGSSVRLFSRKFLKGKQQVEEKKHSSKNLIQWHALWYYLYDCEPDKIPETYRKKKAY